MTSELEKNHDKALAQWSFNHHFDDMGLYEFFHHSDIVSCITSHVKLIALVFLVINVKCTDTFLPFRKSIKMFKTESSEQFHMKSYA